MTKSDAIKTLLKAKLMIQRVCLTDRLSESDAKKLYAITQEIRKYSHKVK